MANIINDTQTVYQRLFHELVDPRSSGWFLIEPPWTPWIIMGLYVLFVVKLGPSFMKNRPPYELNGIINVYNVFQIVICAYAVERFLTSGWSGKYRFFCEPIDYSNDPMAVQHLKAAYLYYLLKILDLMDTVFIILRKRQNQITLLHVYHHASMIMIGWMWARYWGGGHGTLTGMVNSFVHVWMYAYYFTTSMWPETKKNLWWKKYITQLQMIQFIVLSLHAVSVHFISDCPYPRHAACIVLFQNVAFLTLFLNFYRSSYKKKKST